MSELEFSLPSGQTDEHAAYLRWVLGLLPPDICGFCETHSASPELIVNLPTAKVESVNDVAGEVSHFFWCARDEGGEFGYALSTPDEDACDPLIGRARAFFQLAVWGRFAAMRRPVDKGWVGVFPLPFMPEPSRFEVEWAPKVPHLREVTTRLKMLSSDARPPAEVLKIYARPRILRLIAPRRASEIGEGIVDIDPDTPGEVLLILHMDASPLIPWEGLKAAGWFTDTNLALEFFAVGNYNRHGLTPSLLSSGMV